MSDVIPSVLIFDEDEEMRGLMIGQIKSADFELLQAKNYSEALAHLTKTNLALMVTNSRIPEITLVEFLKRVRQVRAVDNLQILVVMSSNHPHDQELALKAGADDLLLKPFERSALNTKIRNGLKKLHPRFEKGHEKFGRLTFKDLTLDIKSFDVFSSGARIKLTPNEFKLLQALLEHPGTVLSRDRLIELVQGEGVAVIDRAVDTHIFSLRKKLGLIGDSIETVRGEGYRLG